MERNSLEDNLKPKNSIDSVIKLDPKDLAELTISQLIERKVTVEPKTVERIKTWKSANRRLDALNAGYAMHLLLHYEEPSTYRIRLVRTLADIIAIWKDVIKQDNSSEGELALSPAGARLLVGIRELQLMTVPAYLRKATTETQKLIKPSIRKLTRFYFDDLKILYLLNKYRKNRLAQKFIWLAHEKYVKEQTPLNS